MARGVRKGKCAEVTQPGVGDTLLTRYNQPQPLVVPNEREEEKRNVHRVREYWLEHETMRHLNRLLALKIPVATFESQFHQANINNPRYSKGSLRETVKNFFREHVDEHGVKYLTLKLSERQSCSKPSKNVLKRWNLSNGMLFWLYAAVGRSAPPTGDEILEPFYYQKRIDFIRKICCPNGLLPRSKAGGPDFSVGIPAGPMAGAEVSTGDGGRSRRGSTRKRNREMAEVHLPFTELYVPCRRPPIGDTIEPSISSNLPKSESNGPLSNVSPPGAGQCLEDLGAVADLYNYLLTNVWSKVEQNAVVLAFHSRIWNLTSETDARARNSAGKRQRVGESGTGWYWLPDLEKLEEWSFDNGALPLFVQACKTNWSRIEPVWRSWNDDLGNNALDWGDLWREGMGGEPDVTQPQSQQSPLHEQDLPQALPPPTAEPELLPILSRGESRPPEPAVIKDEASETDVPPEAVSTPTNTDSPGLVRSQSQPAFDAPKMEELFDLPMGESREGDEEVLPPLDRGISEGTSGWNGAGMADLGLGLSGIAECESMTSSTAPSTLPLHAESPLHLEHDTMSAAKPALSPCLKLEGIDLEQEHQQAPH